jgi:hypothetical protein
MVMFLQHMPTGTIIAHHTPHHTIAQLTAQLTGRPVVCCAVLCTESWTEAREIDAILAQAYIWKSLFHSSPAHLS